MAISRFVPIDPYRGPGQIAPRCFTGGPGKTGASAALLVYGSALPPAHRFVVKTFSAIVALLVSVFLLIAGSALASLIVPLRAKIEGFPELSIGLLGSAYFAGMLGGSLVAPTIVRRAGPYQGVFGLRRRDRW